MAEQKYSRAMPALPRRAFGKAEAQEVLRYDSGTGLLHWIKPVQCYGGGRPAGGVAGAIKDGYVNVKIYGKLYRGHHIAWLFMTGEWPPLDSDIDHVDRNRSNNAWTNLRLATRAQNNVNTAGRRDNKSGHPGVSFRKDTEKWHARITIGGRVVLLGNFARIEDAIAARRVAETTAYGSFIPPRTE